MKKTVLCTLLYAFVTNTSVAQSPQLDDIQDEQKVMSTTPQNLNEGNTTNTDGLISGGTDFAFCYTPKDQRYGFSIGTQLNKFIYASSMAAVYCHEEEHWREITLGLGYGNHAIVNNGQLILQGHLSPYIGHMVGVEYTFTKEQVSTKLKNKFTYGASLGFGIGVRVHHSKNDKGNTYVTLGYSTRAQEFKMKRIGDVSTITVGLSQNIGATNMPDVHISDGWEGEIHPYLIYDEVSRIYDNTLPHLYGFSTGIGAKYFLTNECFISTGLTYVHTSSGEATKAPLKEKTLEYKLYSLRLPANYNVMARFGHESGITFGIGVYMDYVLSAKKTEDGESTKLREQDGYHHMTAGFSTSVSLMLNRHWDVHGGYSRGFIEQLDDAKEEHWSFGIGYSF